MHLLVLIHEYPPIGGGGGRAAQSLALGLARMGYKITIVSSHFRGLPRSEAQGGVTLYRLPVGRKEPYRATFLSMLRYVLLATGFAWRWLRRHPGTVLHAHFAVPAGAAAWAVHRLTGCPYLLTVHLGDVPGGVPEKTARWFRWVYPLTPQIWHEAARVVAVSRYTQHLAQQAYPGVPVLVIPNGIDVQALAPSRVRVHEPPHIVFAGRMVAQKNPLALVRILARIADLPWRATLMGDGPLRDAVAHALAHFRLHPRVALMGWVSPETVLDIFDTADILLMPSRQEGLPIVGLQALAKGLALVVSRVGGLMDLVVEGENGYLLDPDDEAGFARALTALLRDRRRLLAFRQASLKRAQAFDLSQIVQAYHRLLQQVADEPQHPCVSGAR